MITGLLSWFRSRTVREQVLLQIAVFLLIGIGGPLLAWQAASGYRAGAASDLASAQALRDDIAKLAGMAPADAAPPPQSDGTPRGVALAVAAQWGLKPAHVEPAGPTAIRVTFEPVAAGAVYSWIDAAERAGLVVTRIVMVRAGEWDAVEADATFGPRR